MRLFGRQRQHRVAHHAGRAALGRHEIGAARAVQQVLVSGRATLGVVAVQQRLGRLAAHHQVQLPDQVVHILHARVRAARAEGRNLVRGIAREQQTPVPKTGHSAALEGVDADPFQLELNMLEALAVECGADAWADALGPLFGLGVAVVLGRPTELEIHAPDVVGFAVQQGALLRVERRVEPEAAFAVVGVERRFAEQHVGNEKAVLKNAARHVQTQLSAYRAARAVGHDQPIGVQRVAAFGRFNVQRCAALVGRHRQHLVLPAQIDQRQRLRALHQHLLQVVLLQIDHARPAVARLGQQVEAEHLALAMEGAADVPGHALGHHRVAHAQAVEDVQCALGIAQAARTDADGVVLVQQQHRLAALRSVDGGTQTNRPGTHHHQRHAAGLRRVDVGRAARGVARPGVGLQHGRGPPLGQLSSAAHIAVSRSAVQMRGSRWAVASSKARDTSKGMQWSKITHWPYFGRVASSVSR